MSLRRISPMALRPVWSISRSGNSGSVSLPSRSLHRTSPVWYSRKDSQDRNSINTESTEYSKSGSDAAAASATDSAAFDPSQTRPETEHDTASQEASAQGGDQTSNPLNVSPANQEVSKPRGDTEGGAQGSQGETGKRPSNRERTSGGGSAPKSGGGKYGGSGSGV